MPALGNYVIYITSAMWALRNYVIYITSAMSYVAGPRNAQNEPPEAS